MKAVVVQFDPNEPIFPVDPLYSKEAILSACFPGNRPLIPDWHLVDGCIKMTYWHAIKYYSNVLIGAHMRERGCSLGDAREFIEGHHFHRNARLEELLIYLLWEYPPYVIGDHGFPRRRLFQLVRNRTSECPQPPKEKDDE